MSFLTSFYLLLAKSPSLLFLGISCLAFALLVFSSHGEFPPGWTFWFSFLIGTFVANVFLDKMHCFFTWTLPGWRRRLAGWVLVSGIAVALLSTTVATGLGLPWILSPLMLLSYLLGVYQYLGVYQLPRNHLSRLVLFFLFLLIVLFIADEVVAFCLHHPALTLAGTVIACSANLYSALNVRSAPQWLFEPIGQERQRRWRMPWGRDVGDVWKDEFLGEGIANWLRAGRYETSGQVDRRWPMASLFLSMFTMFFTLVVGYILSSKRGDGSWVHSHFAVTLTGSPPMETALLITVSFIVCMCFFPGTMSSFSLRQGWLYPLSRVQLAHLTYFGSLLQALSFTLMLGACFVVAGALVGHLIGRGYSLADSSRILGLTAWGPVYAPLMQWAHHTMMDSKLRPKSGLPLAVYGLFVLLPWGFAGLCHQYLLAAIGAYTFALLGVLFAALQACYFFGLRRYYARADLI